MSRVHLGGRRKSAAGVLRPSRLLLRDRPRTPSTTFCSSAPAIPRAASWRKTCSTTGARTGFWPSARAVIPRATCIRWRSRRSHATTLPTDGLAQQELGRVRGTRRAGVALRLHRLRPRGRRGLSDLARSTDDGALGHRGSGRGGRGPTRSIARAFDSAFRELDARIKIFTSLRFDKLDRLALQRELDAIGRQKSESSKFEVRSVEV